MDEITAILVDLLIFFAARVAGEIFTRLHQPAIVAEVPVVWLYRYREQPPGLPDLVADP